VRDPKERLRDILEAISNIERYSARGRDVFERSELLQNYFLRQLQIIGEAARALPEDIRALSSAVPWSSIIGMRAILIHGYFDIDTNVVWDAVVNDIPQLKPHVETILASLER
jgi:uncharacterized protein with HEPN domain